MKRVFDILASFFGLLFMSPILLVFMYLIYRQDKHSPLYIAPRVGKNGKMFNIIKLRSMSINADKNGANSTSLNDTRITEVGHKIRKYKLDEFTQLWNVLIGDMSLVGPRPNVLADSNLYTNVERKLLTVRPGITDFSSIVFSDEGKILENKKDPDLAYNQLIRPWKSRLGLIYIQNQSLLLDVKIIIYTLIAIISKQRALNWVSSQLESINVDSNVVSISKRKVELYPFPPPGIDKVITRK
jgi:lipopolysaccharide/colanic/teichoic acid biosynthesis glycosyltransferase